MRAMPSARKTTGGPPTPPHDETAAHVLRQFRQVFNAVKTHFQQVEKRAGLGGAQLWALSLVQAQPGLGMKDLAAGMDIHQSTASNLAKALVERGLVEARKELVDRRTVQLHLLPEGRKVLRKAPAPFSGVLPDALQRMDPKALARLRKDLAVLLQTLGGRERDGHVHLGEGR
jgi:DNA-binding MarR family transcriptional regulator